MPYRKIKKAEVESALQVLEENDRDFDKTSQETGIHSRTLRRWDQERQIEALGQDIPEMLETVIKNMLSNPPDFQNGQGWGIAVGILIDKLLLVKGKATSRHETVSKIQNMSDEEYMKAIEEAESILNRAKGNLSLEGSEVESDLGNYEED